MEALLTDKNVLSLYKGNNHLPISPEIFEEINIVTCLYFEELKAYLTVKIA